MYRHLETKSLKITFPGINWIICLNRIRKIVNMNLPRGIEAALKDLKAFFIDEDIQGKLLLWNLWTKEKNITFERNCL